MEIHERLIMMWSPEDFQRVAVSTKLSARTLAACRDVLVDGKSGVDAAAEHGMPPPQISRGLKILRDRQEEMIKSAKYLTQDTNLLKFTAEQVAKNIIGDEFEIEDAQPGKRYEGMPVVNTHGFFVQRVGRSGVIHDVGKLDQVPAMNSRVRIEYPKDGGLAKVERLEPGFARRAEDLGK